MKRTLVLTLMALIIAIVGVQPLFAQDLGFGGGPLNGGTQGLPRIIPGLTNQGVTGAQRQNFLLNTSTNSARGLTPIGLSTFNVRDLAVGDFNADGQTDFFAVSSDGGVGRATLFVGEGDGTFGLPLVLPLSGLPTSVASTDIDLDGVSDIVVGFTNGNVQVMTGSAVAFAFPTGFDGLLPGNGAPVVSVAFGRINDDVIQDVVTATQPAGAAGVVRIYPSSPAFTYSPGVNFALPVAALIGTSAGANVPAPRAIATGVSNFVSAGSAQPDSDIDVFIATSTGVQILENTTPTNGFTPTFVPATTPQLLAGSSPVGVIVADVTADNIPDVIALNRGSGTLSTFVGLSTAGYNTPRQSLTGANPVSLSLMNFNSDGRIDVVVANAGVGAIGSLGTVTVLTGGNTGAFTLAATFSPFITGDPITFPTSVAVGRFDLTSQSDDLLIGVGGPTVTIPGIGTTGNIPGGVVFLSAGAGYSEVLLKIVTAVSLAADFDGNGGLNDIAVMEQNIGIVVVLLNVSTSAAPNIGLLFLRDLFTSRDVRPTSASAFKDALTGLNDIAVTDINTPQNNNGFGQIIVGLNDGTGNFLDLRQFRQFVATPGATNILNGDFNNDGIDDLVYVDFQSNFAAVALNDGTNFFLTPQFRETGGFVPVSAAIADVNDDDNLDVVVANAGNGSGAGNQSIVSVLNGTGDGRLVPTGSLLQVPNFALSLVGGLADQEANGVRRVVDFNGDGFPDFAVVSTRGGQDATNFASPIPTVSLILNRPDAPGNFNVQPPIALVDDTSRNGGTNLVLEDFQGGPGLVSGRLGQNSNIPNPAAPTLGIGQGGANYTLAVADFNADGSPDLVVTGSQLAGVVPGVAAGVNFRSVIYLVGNETNGTVRVSRPQRTSQYTLNGQGVADPLDNGGDTFVACATGNFAPLANRVPDVVHLSVNGNLWIDANLTSILNHAPILTIRRADLNAPFPGGGRKEIITAGQSITIPVTGFDPDGDRLAFSLVPPPTGEQPPSFVTIKDNGNNTATVTVNSGDINRGPGNAIFRIAVQATDKAASGPGGRLPLIGREYFTLVVKPNTPPTIGAIANVSLEAGKTTTVNLSVSDKEGNTVSNSVKCDKGSFVSVNGTTLTIAPQSSDVGATTCTVTATDQFGLSSSTTFAITVTAPNLPPTIASIADQTVKAGQSITVNVSASDPNKDALRLSLTSAPAFVSLSDNGNGTGVLRIAPALTDSQGGRVTVQVTDAGGLTASTSFNVTVQKAVVISAASFDTGGKQLFISGTGFGSTGAKVTVNGQDVSSRVSGQSDTSITVKGNKKKLNLKSGPNQIIVTSGGVASNTFVLNLLSAE